MKKILIFLQLLLFFLLSYNIYSQDFSEISEEEAFETMHQLSVAKRDVQSKKPIGLYNLLVKYRFQVNDNFDIMKLEIGHDFSRYYSENSDQIDSAVFNQRTKENKGYIVIPALQKKGQVAISEDYYQNYPEKGKLRARIGIQDTEYEYDEDLPNHDWHISMDSTAVILGYDCHKASCKFRGRDYNVWFSFDIPFSYGPWKFCGLPGLILKVENDIFSWEAIGLEQKTDSIHIFDPEYSSYDNGISVPLMRIKKVSRKQARKLERNRWADPLGFIIRKGIPITVNDKDINSSSRERLALPEVPALELE